MRPITQWKLNDPLLLFTAILNSQNQIMFLLKTWASTALTSPPYRSCLWIPKGLKTGMMCIFSIYLGMSNMWELCHFIWTMSHFWLFLHNEEKKIKRYKSHWSTSCTYRRKERCFWTTPPCLPHIFKHYWLSLLFINGDFKQSMTDLFNGVLLRSL